jgi:predicted  nucleic acid-binding Zn-ribbon protein
LKGLRKDAVDDSVDANTAALIAHLHVEIARLDSKSVSFEKRIEVLEREKDTLAAEKAALETRLALADNKIGGLLHEIRTLHNEIRDEQALTKAARERITELERSVERRGQPRRPEHDIPLTPLGGESK